MSSRTRTLLILIFIGLVLAGLIFVLLSFSVQNQVPAISEAANSTLAAQSLLDAEQRLTEVQSTRATPYEIVSPAPEILTIQPSSTDTDLGILPSVTSNPTSIAFIAQTATRLAELFSTPGMSSPIPPPAGGIKNTDTPRPTPTTVPSFDPEQPTLSPLDLDAMDGDDESEIEAESTALPDTGGGGTGGDFAGDEPDTPTVPAIATTPPVEIAGVNLLVRSAVSGAVIGNGTLRLFAPSTANGGDPFTVELELRVDNLYITPTPTGQRGTAAPRTSGGSGDATPTPRVAIREEGGVDLYQRLGATLLCPVDAFTGCDGTRSEDDLKIVTNPTLWRWNITPSDDISGFQNLRVEVWISERNLDGVLEFIDLPADPPLNLGFRVEIDPAGGTSPVLWIAVATAIVAALGGAFFLQKRKSTPSPALAFGTSKDKPKVFISYRRGTSWSHARAVADSLKGRGADVFLDVDDINEGRFAEIIEQSINACDYFVPILAPGTLESYWVKREIIHAINGKKVMVPLLVENFTLNETSLPPELHDVASHNAITMLPEFYEEAIDRLAKRFMKLE